MNNKTSTKSLTEIEEEEQEEETGGYLQISFSRAPKKNHDVLAQLGKQFEQWLKKYGVSSKIYYLNSSTTSDDNPPPDGVESIRKILSISDDKEELWVALQFYRDRAHADEVRGKMMQDESVGAIMKEFDGLVSQGKSLITDGFSRLGT